MSIVKVLMDGKTFQMEVDKDTTILEKAMDEDIDIPFSCQSGICTSCIGKLNEGKVEMEVNDGLSDEELERLGWEQFHLKILRQDLDVYLNADKELGELQSKIDYTKQKVDFVENIIKQLVNRGYLIKNAIDFMRFQTGG